MNYIEAPKTLMKLLFSTALVAVTLPAAAQFVDDDFRLRTVPETAIAGQPVTVVLEGAWGSCPPVGGHFLGSGLRRTIVLQAPPEDTICLAVVSPFSVAFADTVFDDNAVGTIDVALVYSTGDLLGLTSLAVQSASPDAPSTSLYDVSGAWFSAESSGSGLMLVHDKSGKRDGVVGGWANFRQDGSARWYALQGDGWVSPIRLVGTVFQAKTEAFPCKPGFPTPVCDFAPRPATESIAIGQFSIEFDSADEATLVMSQTDASGQQMEAEPVTLIRLR